MNQDAAEEATEPTHTHSTPGDDVVKHRTMSFSIPVCMEIQQLFSFTSSSAFSSSQYICWDAYNTRTVKHENLVNYYISLSKYIALS